MLDFRVLCGISSDAIKSMKRDSDDKTISSTWKSIVFFLLFYICPFIVAGIAMTNNIKLTSLEQYVGASIAIFTGLFFSLLLNIGAKIKAEKDNPNRDDNNFQKFKNNLKQISSITLYVIILGIVIFLLMLLNSLFKSDACLNIERGFTVITLYFLTKFIVSLLFMLQRYYFVVKDEINNIL